MMKKTNAKRVLAAALAGMMALSLSACGEQGGGSPTETPAARRLCPRRIGRLCRRSLPLEQP